MIDWFYPNESYLMSSILKSIGAKQLETEVRFMMSAAVQHGLDPIAAEQILQSRGYSLQETDETPCETSAGELDPLLEEKRFIQIINETYEKYFKYGPTSPKKVDHFHSEIKRILEQYFTIKNGFSIELEFNIKSFNSSGKKKCDIVILKNNIPYIIFPVKIIMSNYKQNKNNSWENLTGELIHIKWCNPDIHIIPINILMDKTPYLKTNKKIKNFENVTRGDIENYNELIKNNICYDIINYIVEVEHINKADECFDKIQPIKKFITPYKSFGSIISKLL